MLDRLGPEDRKDEAAFQRYFETVGLCIPRNLELTPQLRG
jgi:hypothetical protein